VPVTIAFDSRPDMRLLTVGLSATVHVRPEEAERHQPVSTTDERDMVPAAPKLERARAEGLAEPIDTPVTRGAGG
jgi:hypothetical protein